MPRHHAPHAPNVGPNLFAHNENIAHLMPRVTAHAGKPAALNIRGAPEITYGRAIRASRTIYNKINHLTF